VHVCNSNSGMNCDSSDFLIGQHHEDEEEIGGFLISDLKKLFRTAGIIGETRDAVEYLHHVMTVILSRILLTNLKSDSFVGALRKSDSDEFVLTVQDVIRAKPMNLTILGFGCCATRSPFSSDRITSLLAQIHPNLRICESCMAVIQDLNSNTCLAILSMAKDLLEKQCAEEACSITSDVQALGYKYIYYESDSVGKVYCCGQLREGFEPVNDPVACLSEDHIKGIVPHIFHGDLSTYALQQITKHIENFQRREYHDIGIMSESELVYHPAEIYSYIKYIEPDAKLTEGFAIALADTIEYLNAELLELCGNAAIEANCGTITPFHMNHAIVFDQELGQTLSKYIIRDAATVPHIHKMFIPSSKEAVSDLNALLRKRSLLAKAEQSEVERSLYARRFSAVRVWQHTASYLLPPGSFRRFLERVSSRVTSRRLIIETEAIFCLQSYVEIICVKFCEQAAMRFVLQRSFICTDFDLKSGWERKRLLLLVVEACTIWNAASNDPILLRKRHDAERREDLWRLIQGSLQLPSLHAKNGVFISTLIANVLGISGVVRAIASYLEYPSGIWPYKDQSLKL